MQPNRNYGENVVPDVGRSFVCQMLAPATGLVADMSAARSVTPWLPCKGSQVSVEFAWPATGTPNGACAIEFTNDPSATPASTGAVFDNGNFPVTPPQPSGTASRMILGPIPRQGAFVRGTYTATSGGAGATLACNIAIFEE